ncbi:MAG: UGSC family (seleno)protein, partial [Halioglobus sp.]
MKVFVEHPIQDRTDEEMAIIADRAFDQVLAMVVEQD